MWDRDREQERDARRKLSFRCFFFSVFVAFYSLLPTPLILYWTRLATMEATVTALAASVKLTYLMSCVPLEYDWLAKWNHCVFACVSHFFSISIVISIPFPFPIYTCILTLSVWNAIHTAPLLNQMEMRVKKLIAFGSLTHKHIRVCHSFVNTVTAPVHLAMGMATQRNSSATFYWSTYCCSITFHDKCAQS